MPGGALGVDVFFVISGFVITRLLVGQLLSRDRVGFRQFYGRRIVRLVPASLVVVAVTAVAALTLNIADRSVVVHDIVPSVFGFKNWHLIGLRSDYWAPHAAATPLDHYWSLAVEDQFYLVWPSFVMLSWLAVRRLTNRLPVMTAVTGALALVGLVAWHAAPTNGAATYFATQYRMGELLLGGFVALIVLQLKRPLPPWAAAAGVGVLAVVVARLAFIHVSVDIAKWGTIISIATAVALFALGGTEERPWVGVLRLRPVVYIGTISYGIYLWHFPVDQLLPRPDDPNALRLMFVVRLAVTLGLAAVSYVVLEHPLRQRAADGRIKPRRAFLGAATGMVVVALLGTVLVNASLAGNQGAIDGRKMVAANRDHPSFACRRVKGNFCSRAGGGQGPVLAVIGDSHAIQWDAAWKAIARDHQAEYLYTRGPCAIAPGLEIGAVTRCRDAWQARIHELAAVGRPTVAVLAFHVVDDAKVAKPVAQSYASGKAGLDDVVAALESAGIPTIVLTPIPEFPSDVPRCLALKKTAKDCDVAVAKTATAARGAMTHMIDDAAASRHRVASVHIDDVVCPGGTCLAMDGGIVTRSDNDHLSVTYATKITPKLVAAITQTCGNALSGSWFCL